MKILYPFFLLAICCFSIACAFSSRLPLVSEVELKLEISMHDTFRFRQMHPMIFQVKMTNLSDRTVQVSDPKIYGNGQFELFEFVNGQKSAFPIASKFICILARGTNDERVVLAPGKSVEGNFAMAINFPYRLLSPGDYWLEFIFTGNIIEGNGKPQLAKSRLVATTTFSILP